MTFRSVQLRRVIATLPCACCGRQDGTVVAAHYFGRRRHLLGGGMGHKATDASMAALCSRCHQRLDSYADGNTWERSEEFLFYVAKTYNLLWERGYLNVRWALAPSTADAKENVVKLLLMCLLLAGCVGYSYVKPDSTPGEVARDEYECRAEAYEYAKNRGFEGNPLIVQERFHDCMTIKRGYRVIAS